LIGRPGRLWSGGSHLNLSDRQLTSEKPPGYPRSDLHFYCQNDRITRVPVLRPYLECGRALEWRNCGYERSSDQFCCSQKARFPNYMGSTKSASRVNYDSNLSNHLVSRNLIPNKPLRVLRLMRSILRTAGSNNLHVPSKGQTYDEFVKSMIATTVGVAFSVVVNRLVWFGFEDHDLGRGTDDCRFMGTLASSKSSSDPMSATIRVKSFFEFNFEQLSFRSFVYHFQGNVNRILSQGVSRWHVQENRSEELFLFGSVDSIVPTCFLFFSRLHYCDLSGF
jgi:hypothetical protein